MLQLRDFWLWREITLLWGGHQLFSLKWCSVEKAYFRSILIKNRYLIELLTFMDKNKQYDIIRVKLPFLQYYHVDGDSRFVIGQGQVTGVHYRGGDWATNQ